MGTHPKVREKLAIGMAGVAYVWQLDFFTRQVTCTWHVGDTHHARTWQIQDLPARNPGAQAGVSEGQRTQQLLRFVAGQISVIADQAPDGVHSIAVFRGELHAPAAQASLLAMTALDNSLEFDHVLRRSPMQELPTRVLLRLN